MPQEHPDGDLTGDGPALVTVTPADLATVGEELATYHARFAPLFTRREQRAWAAIYLRGLLIADVPRKNVEAMALRLLGAGPHAARQVRALQQFIGEGAWDDDAILAEHQRLVAETLGEADGVLLLDGSDIPKRGHHSVGVAPQWCGATGKTDNCQAGVFLGYASRKGYTLLDRRLYLPQSWFDADHAARWRACRIPADVAFQTKGDLAAELIEQAQQRGTLPATWLACDEWFGRHRGLLERIDAAGLWYLAEVPRTTQVWPLREPTDARRARPRPRAWLPPRAASGKGRLGTHERLHPDSPPALPVEAIAAHLAARRWQRYRILEGRKGPIVADFAAFRAFASRDGYREGLPGPEVWVLIRRAPTAPGHADALEVKYYVSNAPADTPLAELIRVCGMRWPIECCFEESKGELGMDHYELRFWQGWHHHMTMVILAHHFLVRLQRRLMQHGSTSAPTPSAGVREGGRDAASSGRAPGGTALAPAGRPVAQSGGGALLAASRTAAAYA